MTGVQTCALPILSLPNTFPDLAVALFVVPFELDQEPSNGRGHETDAAKLRHVRFDVGGIEPLFGDVQIQQLDEFRGHVVHDLLGQFIVAKQRDVSLESTAAKALILGLEVERVLKVDVEHVGVSRFLVSPVAELHDEEQAGHRI